MSWRNESQRHSLSSRGISTNSRPPLSKSYTQHDINYILAMAKNKYHLTDDPRRAIFLLPDGSMISDKGFEMHDDIKVEDVAGEYKFNYLTGSISLVFDNNLRGDPVMYARIYQKPTSIQIKLLKEFKEVWNYRVCAELIDCIEGDIDDDKELFCTAEATLDFDGRYAPIAINRYFTSDFKGKGRDVVTAELTGNNPRLNWDIF